jgi:VanZ family protein
MDCGRIPFKILIAFGAAVFAGIIILGFNPRHALFTNKVSRLGDGPGLRFRKYAIAATKPFDLAGMTAGFSMEIAFQSDHRLKNGFGLLFMLHDGDDAGQLLMGQWRSHIIVMNGDDYDYSRKAPRISADTAPLASEPILAAVTTGPGGTRLYFNGRRVIEKKRLRLTIPGAMGVPRLVMGNSVYGNTSWEGDIQGFAIYPGILTPPAVAAHHDAWLRDGDFSFAAAEDPAIVYLFDDAPGGRALDRSGRGRHLEIPPRVTVFKRQLLAFPSKEFSLRPHFIRDVFVNFAGFVPFGFLVAAILYRLRSPRRHAVAVALAAGFAISLGIEVAQSWMPSRSSSLLDLVMNTAGTASGAAVCGLLCRR